MKRLGIMTQQGKIKKLLKSYAPEANARLNIMHDALQHIKKNAASTAHLELFSRNAHTLKGMSATAGLEISSFILESSKKEQYAPLIKLLRNIVKTCQIIEKKFTKTLTKNMILDVEKSFNKLKKNFINLKRFT